MKTKIFTFFGAVMLAMASLNATTVTVGTSGTYPSIAQAIAGIGTITEPLIIELTADYVMTADSILAIPGADATNTVTIRPQGSLTVAGTGGFVWKMKGCSYVTIDGRVGGSGATVLTLKADTIVGNSLLATPLLKKNSALITTNCSNNVIQYVNFKGATSESYWRGQPIVPPTMGTVTLASGTTNLSIDHCDLGPINNITGTPTVALVSLGTAIAPNSGIVISNNNIYDYFALDLNKCVTVASSGVGVLIYDYNSNCTVSGNSFYKTYAHPAAMFANNNNARTVAVAIQNTSGSGFIVKDNYIGGSAPECGGSEFTVDIRNNSTFDGVYLSTSTSALSAVYGNTIKNLMILSHSQVAQTYQCSGIFINGGKVNVGIKEDGTTASPNIIGDMSASSVGANASIKFCGTNNNAAFSGIIYNSLADGNVKISNNKIGGVSVNLFKDYTTVRSASFVGVNILGTVASTMLIDNNQIGNNETGIAPSSMSIQNYMSRSNYGINVNPALAVATSLTITNNRINNMYHAQQIATQTYNHGIFINTSVLCPVTISGNEIRDLVFTNGRVNDTPINWGGAIFCGSQGAGSDISNNTIYNIEGLSAASTNVIGIQLNPTVSAAVMNVYNNKIYNLSSNVTRKLGQYATGSTGIFAFTTGAVTPTLNVYNNMIRLGYDRTGNGVTLANTYIGIRDSIVSTSSVATANYYGNTIYIGGSNVAASDSISAFGMCFAAASSVTRNVKNNLLINARSNTSGSGAPANRSNIIGSSNAAGIGHYAIVTGGGSTGLTNFNSNNNDYVANGTGGVLGRFALGAEAINLAAIQSYTGGDLNSIADLSPVFVDATGSTPNLHLNQSNYNFNEGLNYAAILPAPFNVDYDGNERKSSNRTIGGDEYFGAVTSDFTPANSNIFVSVAKGEIIVNNIKAGQTIVVLGLNGQLVKQTIANEGQTSLKLQSGIYLVKTSQKIFKVVI